MIDCQSADEASPDTPTRPTAGRTNFHTVSSLLSMTLPGNSSFELSPTSPNHTSPRMSALSPQTSRGSSPTSPANAASNEEGIDKRFSNGTSF